VRSTPHATDRGRAVSREFGLDFGTIVQCVPMRLPGLASLLLAAVVGFAPAAVDAAGKGARGRVADARLERVQITKGRARASQTHADGELALTLDTGLQRDVERILAASKAPSGAVVVSDVRTGRVLAWASRGGEGDLVRKAKYPGASLFKVVTATALLESGKLHLGDTVCHQGGESRLEEADVAPGCRAGDRRSRFEVALGKSLNPVFARQAVKHLDPVGLGRVARDLGIGEAPPLDLPADRTSIRIPADTLGFARAAAGFGDARMSPLAALDLMQTIANRGERIRLHVTGNPVDVPRVSLGHPMRESTADALVRMLEVTTRSGTSEKAFERREGSPNVRVAGKTGTLAFERPKRLVSWFAGFAPSRDPEIAVAVLLANDARWWRKGNEVARDVFDAYFTRHPR
jgi:peptidoglycan glycosyltransferase